MSIKTEIKSNNTDLQSILATINALPEAGEGGDITLQTKTVTPTTAKQEVTPDSGYDGLEKVTVNAMPTATQATPSITVSTTGLITAKATQSAGYVASGTKSATKQLTVQAAKTVTPTESSQTAVASGRYTTGAVTVGPIPDGYLVGEEITAQDALITQIQTALQGKAAGGGGNDPFITTTPFTYTVNAISGASYGFAINSDGYYESQNQGKNTSYAICRVNFIVTSVCNIVFDVINYAESNYDYALFGNLDSSLSLSSSADTTVKKSFKGEQSASVVNVTYSGVTVGNHYIDIKFIKDSSQNANNDSVQFKIQEQGSLSQETIDKILAADPDLVAENIKSGVNIFGINGTIDVGAEDALISGDMTSYTNNTVTDVKSYAFYYTSKLTSINLPAVTRIDVSAFYGCGSLTFASFPSADRAPSYAFAKCYKLTSLNLDSANVIDDRAFMDCSSLTTLRLPSVYNICSYAFMDCPITTLYVLSSKVCTLSASAFYRAGITSTTGSIFVPASLVTSYKTATNWAAYSTRIFPYTGD